MSVAEQDPARNRDDGRPTLGRLLIIFRHRLLTDYPRDPVLQAVAYAVFGHVDARPDSSAYLTCWPSVETIADQAGVSVKTATRKLRAICGGPQLLFARSRRGDGRTNVYTFVCNPVAFTTARDAYRAALPLDDIRQGTRFPINTEVGNGLPEVRQGTTFPMNTGVDPAAQNVGGADRELLSPSDRELPSLQIGNLVPYKHAQRTDPDRTDPEIKTRDLDPPPPPPYGGCPPHDCARGGLDWNGHEP